METDKLTNSSNTGLQRITNQLAISNRLIIQIDSKRVMRLLLKHPYFAANAVLKLNPLDYKLLIQVAIADKEIFDPWNMWYTLPVDENLMEVNFDQINWDYISINHNFPFNKTFIEKYKDSWAWYALSSNINLNSNVIGAFKENWVWGHLSGNTKLVWTKELIKKYESNWDWNSLSYNPSLPYSIGFIREFEDYWDWNSLSNNPSLPYSIEFIREFEDYWSWDNLSFNEAVPWSLELLEAFKQKLNWQFLSTYPGINRTMECLNEIPWTIGFIQKFENLWDWELLSKNENIPFSVGLIDFFIKKWNWSSLSSLGAHKFSTVYLTPKGIIWSEELIDSYLDKWNWFNLSRNNGVPWTISKLIRYKKFIDYDGICELRLISLSISKDFIIENEDKWNWTTLSSQFNVEWDNRLIEKYKDKWNWKALSSNFHLRWNVNLIEKYFNRWDWSRLSINGGVGWNAELISRFIGKFKTYPHEFLNDDGSLYICYYTGGLDRLEGQSLIEVIEFFNGDIVWNEVGQNNAPWSIPFIGKYKDKINWTSFSKNTYIQWSDDLLNRFEDYWDWSELGHNSSLPWSIELLEKFEEKCIWGIFNENVLKIFEPFFSDDFVETMLVNILDSYDKKEA